MAHRKGSSSGGFSRRDFHRLAGAAVGGLVLGAPISAHAADNDPSRILTDPHVCRGLNTCKGKGKDKDNSCAGAGKCATADAHGCGGSNACKGQGGCGDYPGENACKGQGDCHVPLKKDTWKKARKTFETQMKKKGKTFADAPKASA